MHKSDYLAQVEALRASPELRARVAGLAGAPARRRRLRPWMGVCACLAVLLLGGTLLLPRLGGSSAGGGGHATGSIFQSYAGPVFPLTTLEDAGLTARRTITLDFAPWGDGHTTDIDVTDSYVLTNPTGADQSVTLVYPFSGSFYALYPPTLTADGTALDAVIRPGVGGSQSLESWEEYAALVEGNDLAAAHAEIPALDTPVTVYAFTDLTRPESDAAAPTLAVTYPWSEDTPAVLTYGFHGSSIDREAGWARRSFSLPEPDSPHAQDPRLLIAVGGALEEYTIQGYRDGGCDPGEELDGVSAAVIQYKSTLGEVLEALCPPPDTLAHKYGGETDAASLSREVFFDTLCRSLGTAVPADMARLEDVFSWVNIQERIFYAEAVLTIPAGESVQVEAALPKEASFDFACAHTENRGIYGYDLVTQLGSALSFTCQTAALAHTEQIAIVRQNFGFDLAAGLTSVPLEPDQEYYYLEVRRSK